MLLYMSDELQCRGRVYDELSLKSIKNISKLKKLPIAEKISINKPIDFISLEKLGDEQYWWVLAYINDIIDPMDIPHGTVIKIPDKSSFESFLVDAIGEIHNG
jgi:hypothetical protein